jgi:hypothetical protein
MVEETHQIDSDTASATRSLKRKREEFPTDDIEDEATIAPAERPATQVWTDAHADYGFNAR